MESPSDDGVPPAHVLVEEAKRGSRRIEHLPPLRPADSGILSALLESAWSEPGRWHRLPESDLSFRATSGRDAAGSFSFEIRDDRFPDEPRCYRYERERSVLSCRTDHAVELCDLPHDHRLPRDTDTFALAAIAVADPAPRRTLGEG